MEMRPSTRPIFLSYRREDTEGQAGRLFQDLRNEFGAENVFMDVATIEPGVDFRRAIEQSTEACGVLLALIGKDWLRVTDADGRRRLDDSNDFVRLEIGQALRRGIPVIPVLVQGARMPRQEELPEDLRDLAFRNSVELTHARWDSDIQSMIAALYKLLARLDTPVTPVARDHVRFGAISAAGARRQASSPRAWVLAAVTLGVLFGGWQIWTGSGKRVAPATPLTASSDRPADERKSTREDTASKSVARQGNVGRVETQQPAGTERQVDAQAPMEAQRERDAQRTADARREADAKRDAAARQEDAQRQADARRLADAQRRADAERLAQIGDHNNGVCRAGFVWREAIAGDKVCVTPETRDRTAAENRLAVSRRQSSGGSYGANTCKQGYVWREAFANDVVCVPPESRQMAAADNGQAGQRVVPLP